MSKTLARFRGGVSLDASGWSTQVELTDNDGNVTLYVSDDRYTCEAHAMTAYREVRAKVLAAMENVGGVTIGQNLGGYSEIKPC